MRVRITMIVREWIPTDVVAEREVERHKSNERRPPPTPVTIVVTSRAPRPMIVVVHPPAVVIRRPSPWFISYPGPSVRRAPGPAAVTIGGPVVVAVDNRSIRLPDPTVLVCKNPTAICIQILRAPNIVVVVLGVVTKTLRDVLL